MTRLGDEDLPDRPAGPDRAAPAVSACRATRYECVVPRPHRAHRVHPCTSQSTRCSSSPTVGLHLRPRRRPRQRSTELIGRRPHGVPDAARDHPSSLPRPSEERIARRVDVRGPSAPGPYAHRVPETREDNMTAPQDGRNSQRGEAAAPTGSTVLCPSARPSLLG